MPTSRPCVADRPARSRSTTRSSASSDLLAGAGPGGIEPVTLFCDNETNSAGCSVTATVRAPEGRHQPLCRRWSRHGEPAADGHQGRVLVRGAGRARGDGGTAAADATARLQAEQGVVGARPRLRQGRGQATKGGRRVLRRVDPGRRVRRRGAGDAPGVRRDVVEQAVHRVRRLALARRRPHPAGAPGESVDRPELAVATLRVLRHHVDARQVGVPVVRRVGSGVPCVALAHSMRRSPSTSCS